MKTVLVGVGQAGGKVATALARYDDEMGFRAIRDALAVNSAKTDLQGLPLDTVLIGQDVVKGHGVGADNEIGVAVMQRDTEEVMTDLSDRIGSETEAIVVVAGLGGGTGSGGAPVLISELTRVYDVPVYALGILPGRDEGALYQANAGRSLKTLAREADSTILIDNDAWREVGDSVAEGMAAVNENIARRIGLLLAAGEPAEDRSLGLGEDGVDRDVGQSVVDTSEVINTLRSGGLSAVGYAESEAGEATEDNVNVVTSTVRKAVLSGTSLPNATQADSALVVVAGHPDSISRKGVERARRWVEEETGSMAVRGGDFPLDSDGIAALVVLSGVERSPRVTEFLNRAADAQVEEHERDEGTRKRDAAEAFQNDQLDDLL
ncbi:MAG: tubulin/FtsZ family protein [Halolamina sp.]